MVFTIGLGDAIWSGRIPGASFFIMMIVIIKSSPETIKQICFLLNYEVNNNSDIRHRVAAAVLAAGVLAGSAVAGCGPAFAALMLDGFQREISQLGYTLNTHRVTPEDLAAHTLPLTFSKERTSAIVCIEMFDRAYNEMVCTLGLPVLFVDAPPYPDGNALPADHLYMENIPGVVQLVNAMLAKGVRKIGFIGDWDHCQSFFERYIAFRSAMLLAGVPVDERWLIKETFGEGMVRPLGELTELPELFVCANDFVACDAMRVLRSQGRRVPEDVRISGFDDAPESRRCDPPLTTIHIHTQIMAFSAVHLLMSRIKQPSLDYRTIYTETELIWRPSTDLP